MTGDNQYITTVLLSVVFSATEPVCTNGYLQTWDLTTDGKIPKDREENVKPSTLTLCNLANTKTTNKIVLFSIYFRD